MYDCIVVGAGPAGSHAAKYLALGGHDVLVVEEHDEVGQPVQCAGLVTPRTFDLLDFDPDRVDGTPIRAARIHPPGGGEPVEVRADEVQAYATDRAAFDRNCFANATRAGAKTLLGTRVVGFDRLVDGEPVEVRGGDGDGGAGNGGPGRPSRVGGSGSVRGASGNGAAAPSDGPGDGVRVHLRRGDERWTEEARLVVGADGPGSVTARWFGLPRPREFISCYGAQMTDIRVDPDTVEMYFGAKRAPNFFSWIVPTGPASGKVEVGVSDALAPVKHYFERMAWDPASHDRIGRGEVASTIAGAIPIGPVERSYADRVLLVGDAAAQTKPTTGGGLYTGLRCAEHAAHVASKALDEDDLSAKRLAAYQDRWEGDVGGELRAGWKLRKAFMHLDDDRMDDLFEVLRKPRVLDVVESAGDIDHQSRVARALLREAPSLFRFADAALKGLLA